MMAGLRDGIKAIQESAYVSATEVLSALSFEECEKRVWCGPLYAKDGVRHDVKLDFPSEFPDQLP